MNWDWLVALGTIALAAATFLSVYQTRKQMKILLKQVNLQVGEHIPHLFIRGMKFNGDSIKIDVENATNAPAFWLGLTTSFYFIRLQYSDSPRGGRQISWGEAIKLKDEGKTVFGKHILLPRNPQNLTYNERKVEPIITVTFLAPQGVSKYFPPKTTIQVNTSPIFGLLYTNGDKTDSEKKEFQGLEFTRFRNFLLQNNISEIAVNLGLKYKDASEKPVGDEYISSFLINTESDKTLQDCSKHTEKFDFIPLSYLETMSEKYWLPEDQYDNLMSNWHILE